MSASISVFRPALSSRTRTIKAAPTRIFLNKLASSEKQNKVRKNVEQNRLEVNHALNRAVLSSAARLKGVHDTLMGERKPVGDQRTNVDLLRRQQLDARRVCVAVPEHAQQVDLPNRSIEQRERAARLAHPDKAHGAAVVGTKDGGGDHGLDAGAVNRSVHQPAVGLLHLLCHLLTAEAVRVNGHQDVTQQPLARVEAALLNVAQVDLLSAKTVRHKGGQHADRAGAEDHDGAPLFHLRLLLAGVDADRERFAHSTLLEGHAVGDLEAPLLGVREVADQRPVDRGGGEKGHVRTQVVLARLADAAVSTGEPGLEGDAVANLQRGTVGPNFLHDAGALVSEDHGSIAHEVADPSVLPVVDVAAADANALNLDDDLAGLGLGHREVPHLDVLNLLQHHGSVARHCRGSGAF
eukprot:Rhum_TRINITY_DN22961_c0_g1::Rhum_TRINITY_DN22961_c0_g1_i1::g.176642::m.176642